MSDAPHVAPAFYRPKRLAGDERFTCRAQPDLPCLNDFWQWAYSDLLMNTTRGVLAEFIVGSLLAACGAVRDPWDDVDLYLPDRRTIEVKCAAYLRAWPQRRPSPIQFGPLPTKRLNKDRMHLVGDTDYISDLYVLCLFAAWERGEAESAHEKERRFRPGDFVVWVAPGAANPLDLNQWRFWVLTQDQARELATPKGVVTEKRLRAAKVKDLGASELSDAVCHESRNAS